MTNEASDIPDAPSREVSRRKDAMRGELLVLLDRRRRRRAGLRVGAGLLAIVLLAVVAWRAGPAPGGNAASRRGASFTPRGSVTPEGWNVRVTAVHNDPTVLARLVESRPLASSVRFVGDAELLASLAETGASYGLARMAGRFDRLVINRAP